MKTTACKYFIEDPESTTEQMRDVSDLLDIHPTTIDSIDEYGSYNSRENGTRYANYR